MKTRTIILWILLLIITDQAVKIIINIYFINCQFEIIPSLFEFKPYFNDKHSWFNHFTHKNFNINTGLWFHIILFLFVEIIMLALYDYFRNHISKNRKLLDTAFIFQISCWGGAIIGNLVWEKGTLDYIYLKPLFIFDLKDLYHNCFVVLIIIYIHKNISQVKKVKIKEIVEHIKHRFQKNE